MKANAKFNCISVACLVLISLGDVRTSSSVTRTVITKHPSNQISTAVMVLEGGVEDLSVSKIINRYERLWWGHVWNKQSLVYKCSLITLWLKPCWEVSLISAAAVSASAGTWRLAGGMRARWWWPGQWRGGTVTGCRGSGTWTVRFPHHTYCSSLKLYQSVLAEKPHLLNSQTDGKQQIYSQCLVFRNWTCVVESENIRVHF